MSVLLIVIGALIVGAAAIGIMLSYPALASSGMQRRGASVLLFFASLATLALGIAVLASGVWYNPS